MTDAKAKGRLLAVLAHPDDESFGMGGTLALYAARGFEIHLACATRGEAGEAPQDLKGFAGVGEMRESELRCAAGVLGLSGIHLLDYRDSGMAGSPDNLHPQALAAASPREVARSVARLIRALRPHVLLTFDPIGGYRHPDHIAIQRATTEAVRLAADPDSRLDGTTPYDVQRLYYHTFSRTFLRWVVRLLRLGGKDPARFGKNRDVDLASLVDVEFPIHAVIDIRPVIERKEQAAACHSSQGGGVFFTGPMRWVSRLLNSREEFMQAYPQEAPAKQIQDLFAGVDLAR